MNTTEAAELAAELRKAAQDLLLCVNVIVGQEQSLAADLLRHFPGRLELLALRMAPHPEPEFTTLASVLAVSNQFRHPDFVIARKSGRFWQVKEKIFDYEGRYRTANAFA